MDQYVNWVEVGSSPNLQVISRVEYPLRVPRHLAEPGFQVPLEGQENGADLTSRDKTFQRTGTPAEEASLETCHLDTWPTRSAVCPFCQNK